MVAEGWQLTADDLHLFNEGRHFRLFEKLGAHARAAGGIHFAVWAPEAEAVAVAGSFNGWDADRHPLAPSGGSGIWQGDVPAAAVGDTYKYLIRSRHGGWTEKADPFAFAAEEPPRTASRITHLNHAWQDGEWMSARGPHNALTSPLSIYEVHLGSWQRRDDGSFLTYRETAPALAEYVQQCGFTHVEFLPVMEHPFYGSWGYQVTSHFAPSARFGEPVDFMFLVDYLHQNGIGVILDWVPSHFPDDAHGLARFDGSALYEHADPRRGHHPDWDTSIFNYGRNEVRSFLISSALFWLDRYHADGLRVDAVASMLYRDYSRKAGEWIPNQFGGREDLEAVDFLRQLNEACFGYDPAIQMIAEESTAWPGVSRPTYLGGLGFSLKWDMGWMHDTLRYMAHDPVHRKYDQKDLSFRGLYAFTENFTLPLSHDEVVHEKGSLLGRMPGDDWQKFANLRLMLADQWFTPGKKLLFMGGEFGQWSEWDHDSQLDWALLDFPSHAGVLRLVGDLNRLYRESPSLHRGDCDPAGFAWIDCNDSDQSTLSFLRLDPGGAEVTAVVLNFTPVPRFGFRIGVPQAGQWVEVLNSDASAYEGSGMGNLGGLRASDIPAHGYPASLVITLPPLAAVAFRAERPSIEGTTETLTTQATCPAAGRQGAPGRPAYATGLQ